MYAGPGDEPRTAGRIRDRLFLLLACCTAWAAGFALRLVELPLWDHPALSLDGEPLLATHDAYAWLAGALGIGTGADSAMAGLAAFVAQAFHTSLGHAGFWIPAVAAPLVGVGTALWARVLGASYGACAAAGAIACCAPGFFLRTRLGYYDTDLVTLLFPLVQTLVLAVWLAPRLRPVLGAPPDDKAPPPALWLPLAAGAAMRLGGPQWHPMLPHFAAAAVLTASALCLLVPRPGQRTGLLLGMALCVLTAFGGNLGLLAAALLAPCLWRGLHRRLAARPRRFAAFALLAAALLFSPPVRDLGNRALQLHGSYSKQTVEAPLSVGEHTENGPLYPGVVQSVIEARNIDLPATLEKLSGNAFVSGFGIAGLVFTALWRPAALLLAPLLAFAVLGPWLGARMTMFGGPAVALGLVLPLGAAARRFLDARHRRALAESAAALALAAALLLPLHTRYGRLHPKPAVSAHTAAAFKALRHVAPPDATLWSWWDWGYAAQYFARTDTFADGARHGGRRLTLLGRVLTTDSPLQARQLMLFTGLKHGRPWTVFDTRPGHATDAFLASLAERDYDLGGAPPQYVATSWETLRLAYWISYYGTWNHARGTGTHGRFLPLGKYDLDTTTGIATAESGTAHRLGAIELIRQDMLADRDYQRSGDTLLIHEPLGESALADGLVRNALMARLLLCAPDDPQVNEHFSLVYEGFPVVRIWEARRDRP